MVFTIDIGPNLFQLLQLYFVVRYVVPAVLGATLLIVAVFLVRAFSGGSLSSGLRLALSSNCV